MTEQLSMVEVQRKKGILHIPSTHTLFHRNDPFTSKYAAEQMVKSGKITKQEGEVYALFRQYGPGTSKQIAQRAGGDYTAIYHQIQRRKGKLEEKGLLECTNNKVANSLEYRVVV